jgi:hypothetical protein
MQQVEVIIKGGKPVVTVKCVKGLDCKKLTQGLEAALGETVSDTPTQEMYEQQNIKVSH